MTYDSPQLEGLEELLEEAARAHHEATGGVDAAWARWYAEYIDGRLAPFLGSEPGVDAVSGWLTAADEEYRAAARDVGWPRFYATTFLAEAD